MAEYTARHILRKPEYTDNVNVLLDMNQSMQTIDDRINCYFGSSGTKPDVPNGQLHYEADTENIHIKHNGSWLLLGNRKFARGKIALTTVTASGANLSTSAEQGPHLSTTFTAEAGRRYIVETDYNLEFVSESGSSNSVIVTSRYRWANAGAVTTAGTQIGQHDTNLVCDQFDGRPFYKIFEFFPNVTGTVTIGLFLVNQQSSTKVIRFHANASDRIAQLLVRDYGV